MKDHYETLGIDKSADRPQIKRAYFNLVKQYPPERFPKEFKEIRAAYDTLSDEKKRLEYDESIALPEDAAYLFRQAQKVRQQGRHEQAADIYQDILKRYPALSGIRVEYARELEAQGKTGKAIAVWEALCAEAPDNARYAVALADCYGLRGWRKKAVAAYIHALEIDDSNADCWASLIKCHAGALEYDEASSVCLRAVEAVKKGGKESIYLYSCAAIFGTKGDPALTEGYLQDIIRLTSAGVSDSGKDTRAAIPFLLEALKATGQMCLFPYVRKMADTLLYMDDDLHDILMRAERSFEIESLEDKGFSDLFHDLFATLNSGCDCDDCMLEITAMECHFLAEKATYRPQLTRIKKEYPQLYALHAAFFNEALRTHDPQKMLYQRLKTLSKHDLQPTPPPEDERFDSPIQQTVRREEPKVGRNDPCPCGSGKKFKKCCGA